MESNSAVSVTPMLELIARAEVDAHDSEALAAARWVEATAWRFRGEDFEDLLAYRVRLTEEDREELRAFRARMIEGRKLDAAAFAVAA